MEIINHTQEKQLFWKNKRLRNSKALEKEYSKIAPGIPLVNVSFKNLFLKKCQSYFEDIIKCNSSINELERWDSYEITRMFGKGLNPTSLKTAQNDIKYFVSNLEPNSKDLYIIEYGPGSGWSTVMLYNELIATYPDHTIHLLSTDLSPHSIVSTQNTLDYCQIPWRTVLDPQNINNLKDTQSDITLMLGDFLHISSIQEDNQFDGFFSSHGTAYLSQQQYVQLFNTMKRIGKPNSVFVADSLDPLYTVDLDTLHLLYSSIFPRSVLKMPEYVFGKSLKSNSKFFPNYEVRKLIKVNNEESLLFYRWNNYLIRNLRIGYLLQMMKSIKITTNVIEEYREDVYPSYLLKDLLMRNNLLEFVHLNNTPTCPLYISNTAFRLKKE